MRRPTPYLLLPILLITGCGGDPPAAPPVVDNAHIQDVSCAFTPYATCPLPPRQNRLALAVHAGEKNYAGGPQH